MSLNDTPYSAMTRRPRGVLQLLKAYFSTNRIGDLLLLQGKIDEQGLERALVYARANNVRIGQALIDQRLIRRHDLYATLGKQWGVRSLAWGVTLFMSVGAFAPRQARADDRTTYTSSESFQVASGMRMGRSDLKPLKSYPALFGSAEKRSNDLSAFVKWTSMFSRYESQMGVGSNKATLASWKEEIKGYAGFSIDDMARDVNELLNRVEYIEDRDNYGRSDYWATPVEFLKHGGDCEDFAIAKYMSLKSLGVPEERLRIAIVHDTVKNIPHAILIVYGEDGPLVLDNQTKQVKSAEDVTRYKPIFSINRQGWWLHSRGADMQVASASR
jgi:predicted transglutaminase-like cysteine proteinase